MHSRMDRELCMDNTRGFACSGKSTANATGMGLRAAARPFLLPPDFQLPQMLRALTTAML